MPLPVTDVERELTHTRRVRYEGYKRADGRSVLSGLAVEDDFAVDGLMKPEDAEMAEDLIVAAFADAKAKAEQAAAETTRGWR